MSAPSSNNFPQVYEDLGIDTHDLGCIMLDVQKIPTSDVIPFGSLWFKDDPTSHTQGNVSEVAPHVTVLYGLLNSGPAMRKHVDAVLDGWMPSSVNIQKVDFFYSSDPEEPAITIIALVEPTDEIKEGNGRVRLLPHIDTFADYKPHITLAYVKDTSEWQVYVDALNEKYAGTSVAVEGLNYGD